MKPNEIDAIINSKLQEDHQLYGEEIDASKPFIWGEIRSNLKSGESLKWYHLVAAMIIFLILSAIGFHFINQQHKQEIDALSQQMHQFQQGYDLQTSAIASKNEQITSLENEIELITNDLTEVPEDQEQVKTMYLRQVDTVFVTKANLKITDANSLDSGKTHHVQAFLTPVIEEKPVEPEIDVLIYPDFTTNGTKPPVTTPIKLRIGSFTAKKD